MRLKQPKPGRLDRDGAENLAAEAMAFLTAEPARLEGFLKETGLDPADLAAALSGGGEGVLSAALDHLSADDSLLLVFATEIRRKPEEIMAARALLAGASPEASI